MGDSNSNFAAAANGAIFLMLGVLAVVLGLLSAFGIYLYKRSIQPIPPHAEFEQEDGFQPSTGLS
jgi:flagellar biogenesis protein FliO